MLHNQKSEFKATYWLGELASLLPLSLPLHHTPENENDNNIHLTGLQEGSNKAFVKEKRVVNCKTSHKVVGEGHYLFPSCS